MNIDSYHNCYDSDDNDSDNNNDDVYYNEIIIIKLMMITDRYLWREKVMITIKINNK